MTFDSWLQEVTSISAPDEVNKNKLKGDKTPTTILTIINFNPIIKFKFYEVSYN